MSDLNDEIAVDLDLSKINEIKNQMLASDDALVMSEFFKALSDPTRLNMVHAMLLHKWLCVSDIAQLVELSKSAVSHQLAYMRINKLVRVKREGRKVFYALNDSHVESVFALALSHIKE
ncbi:MAG: ArsR/SmtB family transcription factor [Succinivibrio sp.]